MPLSKRGLANLRRDFAEPESRRCHWCRRPREMDEFVRAVEDFDVVVTLPELLVYCDPACFEALCESRGL